MDELKLKQDQIIKALVYLNNKYNLKTRLFFSEDYLNCYNNRTNTIIISNQSVKKESIESLIWTLAHEFRHSMQHYYPSLKDNKDNFEKIKLKCSCRQFAFLIIGFIITLCVDPFTGPYFLVWRIVSLTSFYYIFMNLIYSKEFTTMIYNNEIDADDFANIEVGTAQDLFQSMIYEPESTLIQKYVFLYDLKNSTHPPIYKRLEAAKQYSLNNEIFNYIKR